MFDNLVGLALTSVYTGVVTLSKAISSDVYEQLAKAPVHELYTWYFDAEEKGALWVASGGEHPEPVIAWLDDARRLSGGTSMLVAVLDNGGKIPSQDAVYQFRVPRKPLDAYAIRTLRSSGHYIAYLPHEDEFLVLVSDPGHWHALRRTLSGWPSEETEMWLKPVPSGKPKVRAPSGRPYDPIKAQIHEVMGSITKTATDAAGDLAHEWSKARLVVPDDIRLLESEIRRESKRLEDVVKKASRMSARSAVLTELDEYVRLLRAQRRVAIDLRAKIHAYQSDPEIPTYDRGATPTMLRALERYTNDVASRFGLAGRIYTPVIGTEYATTVRPFPPLRSRPFSERPENTAVMIEIPVDFRLRLGALPMVAREIVGVRTSDLELIARHLLDLFNKGDRHATAILPHIPDSVRSGGLERHQGLLLQAGMSISADLLATAVVGPQYAFAMARFAVGSLGEVRWGSGPPSDMQPSFRTRLGVCLAYLEAIDKPANFVSVYMPETKTTLPGDLFTMVRTATANVHLPPDEEIQGLVAELCAGRIVRAQPTAILAALWQAVVTRSQANSGYLNEIAALFSVAAFG